MRSTQEWLTDRGMLTFTSHKFPPSIRTLAWLGLAWPQQSFGAHTWRSNRLRLCIKKEETQLDGQLKYQRGPAIVQLNQTLHQPRHCRSQHSACPRLNAIIGRLHNVPLYWPRSLWPQDLSPAKSYTFARSWASLFSSQQRAVSTASHNQGTVLSATYATNAGHAADQSASTPAPSC
jgi:hypothetical protein